MLEVFLWPKVQDAQVAIQSNGTFLVGEESFNAQTLTLWSFGCAALVWVLLMNRVPFTNISPEWFFLVTMLFEPFFPAGAQESAPVIVMLL